MPPRSHSPDCIECKPGLGSFCRAQVWALGDKPRPRSSFKEPRQALALTSWDNHYSLTPGCRERGEEGRIHHTLGDRRQRLTSWQLLCTSDTQESGLRAYHSQAARLQGNQSSQPDPSLFTGSRVYDLGAQKKVCSYRGDKRYPRN